MRATKSDLRCGQKGQSLLETAFLIPLLLVVALNAINIGYFFFVFLNLATAPRQGAEYSIQGPDTILEIDFPSASDINTLVSNDITGAIASAAGTPTRVCTVSNGVNNAGTSNQVPICTSYGNAAGNFPSDSNCANPGLTFCPDPEAPFLVLNRVDIQYAVTPLVGGAPFNLIFPNSLTFHRFVYMRAE
jgi:Flp pilus assembly protein TadG